MKLMPLDTRGRRGFVLVSSLLLLIVVTIIALSMFRSFGIQEKIAGNVREKHRALQSAQTAEQFAETWLVSNSATSATVTCGTGLRHGYLGQVQICTPASDLVTLTGNSVTTVPWQAGSVDVGSDYLPTGQNATMSISTTGGTQTQPTYYAAPRFYITDLGKSASAGQRELYKIDAIGYGGSGDAVAVVEATFDVYTSSWDPAKEDDCQHDEHSRGTLCSSIDVFRPFRIEPCANREERRFHGKLIDEQLVLLQRCLFDRRLGCHRH